MFSNTLILLMVAFTAFENCDACDEPQSILHGTHIFLLRRTLVQYVCDRGYVAMGQRLLSCVNGRWKGKPPVCVGTGCPRLLPSPNTVFTAKLNGGVIAYECHSGYKMVGVAEVYCDGQSWSAPPPTCHRKATPAPVITAPPAPSPTEHVAENTAPESVNQQQPSRTIARPIFMDRGEESEDISQESRILPLYKTANSAQTGLSNETSRNPTRPRPNAQARSRLGSPLGTNVPRIPHLFGPMASYANRRQQENSYRRNFPPYHQQGDLYGTRYGSPYGRLPIPQNPILPQRVGQPMFGHPSYHRPTSFYSNGNHRGVGTVSSRGSAPGDYQRQSGPFSRERSSEEERSSTHTTKNDNADVKEQNRTRLQIPDVPVPVEEVTYRRPRPGGCHPRKKPRHGYHVTLPLPRDYNGDEYLYYIEYRCLGGRVLNGGNKTSYCMKDGRWTGRVPTCIKPAGEKNKLNQGHDTRSCSPGYFPNKIGICLDRNECSVGNGGCEQSCMNFPGGYMCECSTGHTLSGNGKTCIDVDECVETGPCSHECQNTPGSFTCSCRVGYRLMTQDDVTCIDVNECLDEQNPCEQSCVNTFGSFECACYLGFHLTENGKTCSETCAQGYMLEIDLESGTESCVDINECEEHSPCPLRCINTPGSFHCSCAGNQILSEDGLSCVGCPRNTYINVAAKLCIDCPENSITEGGSNATDLAYCYCSPGFRGSPVLSIPCTDIDECDDENYGCSHQCVNTIGSVQCECPHGYELELDGRNCQDIDECLYSPDACGKGGLCANVPGGYNCSCGYGYEEDIEFLGTCKDINECDHNNGGCEENCHNRDGGYSCTCSTGSQLNDDGKTCISIQKSCPALEVPEHGRIIPTIQCGQESVNSGRVCLYICNRGYRISHTGQSRRLCRAGEWTGESPSCVSGSWCPPLVAGPGVEIISPGCSGGNIQQGAECEFRCNDPSLRMSGRERTTCGENHKWSYEPPKCLRGEGANSTESAIDRTCPPLEHIESGRILPSRICLGENPVRWGRICVFACQPGHRLVGPHRRMCRPGGWTGIDTKCVSKGWCPALPIPNHVTTYPSACAEHISRPMLRCVFVCEQRSDVMVGSNSTRCGRNHEWSHSPPKCVGQSATSDSSPVPRIICPHDVQVDLAPGQSAANITIAKPTTNMNIIEQRNDGSSSKMLYHSGTTRVRFTAFTDDRRRQASCTMQVHVLDKEPPTVQKCPGTIELETSQELPKVTWEVPLFSDNVRVTSVRKSQNPPGEFTWGTYSVTYTASDASGNTAECAFIVRITRAKVTASRRNHACGEPRGPKNGRTICHKWARGIYCIASCDAGYAFERRPSTYVCDNEGTWTPTDEVPDCISIRAQMNAQVNADDDIPVTLSTSPTATSTEAVHVDSEYSEGEESEIQALSVAVAALPAPELAPHTVSPEQENSSNANPPRVKILSKPHFFRVPIKPSIPNIRRRRTKRHISTSPLRSIGGSITEIRRTFAPPLCRQGWYPTIQLDGSYECHPCAPGTYGTVGSSGSKCVPCSEGYYQDRPGKELCKRCPNIDAHRGNRRRKAATGLRSLRDCLFPNGGFFSDGING